MPAPGVPHFEGSLAIFVGDLRTWVFASQSKAAQHFGLTHSTISRYENGQLKPDPGYLAGLALLLAARLAAGGRGEAGREQILAELNRALHEGYACEPRLASWAELERLAESYRPARPAAGGRSDWGDAPEVTTFYGREEALAALTGWVTAERCRLVAVAGLGGVGKTTLVTRLAEQVQGEFEYTVWRSLRNAPQPSDLLRSYLRGLQVPVDDTEPPALDADLARLLAALREHRCLLVLDNVETILLAGDDATAFCAGYEGYGELLRQVMVGRHQSCLVLTTRELPAEVGHAARRAGQARVWQLDGLDAAGGSQLLRDCGMTGTPAACQDLVAHCSGNPLALQLLAELVRDVFDGDAARYLRHGTPMPAGIQRLLDQQLGRLSPVEQTVLAWLAVARRPATPETLRQEMAGEAGDEIPDALQALARRSLVERSRLGFGLQNVVLERVTGRLVEQARGEILKEQPDLLQRVPLLQAQAPEPLRAAQAQQILQPLAAALLATVTPARLVGKIQRCLAALRAQADLAPGYGAGNLLNLLLHLDGDARGLDFSGLTVWGAYLCDRPLHDVNFRAANLARSVFSDVFAGVNAVALSPDGTRLAVATERRVQLRDWRSGRLLGACADRLDLVWTVAFTPDGATLVSAGDPTVSVWDVATARLRATLHGHTHWVWSLAVSPDGSLLASGSADGTVRLWQLAEGRCQAILAGHAGQVRAVAFSPDGLTLASGGSDGTVHLWETAGGRLRRTLRVSAEEVRAVAFSPDGSRLAAGSADCSVYLWDAAGGEQQVWHGHQAPVSSVLFTPDGEQVISGSYDNTVMVWRAGADRPERTLRGHHQAVRGIALHPDGVTLASGSYDQSLRLWHWPSGQPLGGLYGHTFQVKALAFAPDGCLATGGTDQVVRVWRPGSSEPWRTLEGHTRWVSSLAFSPNGRLLASGSYDRSVRLWLVEQGECLTVLEDAGGWILSTSFGTDGSLLAGGAADGQVHLWQVPGGERLAVWPGHERGVRALAFAHDGALLASGGEDGSVKLWHAQDRRLLAACAGHEGAVAALAFSPDDRVLASAGEDGLVCTWDAAGGRPLRRIASRQGPLAAVAFAAGGRLLVSGGGLLLRRYEPGSDQPLSDRAGPDDISPGAPEGTFGTAGGTLAPMPGVMRGAEPLAGNAFDRAGARLATGTLNGAIRIWDTESGALCQTLQITRPYERMDITGATGLSEAQRAALVALGAIDHHPVP